MTFFQINNCFNLSLPRLSSAFVIVVSLLLIVGCDSFLTDDYMSIDTPLKRVREIQSIQLEDKSSSEPVSVDDAAAEMIDLTINPPKPPPQLDLTLAEVRAAALENNLDLQVELVSPSIAQATVDEEEAKFEAVFFGSASRQKFDGPTAVGTEGTEATIDAFDLGVRIPLRTGGTATIDFPFNKQETNNPFSLLDPAYNADLRFSISHPLLRNAGQRVNTHSIRVAKYDSQIANARTKLESIRILANADRTYWLLYAAKRELEVRQKQYELAIAQLEQARRKVTAGDVAQIEITRAQSGVASRLEAIIIAQTSVRARQRDLKRIMNRPDLPINSETSITPTTLPQPVGLDLPADELADFAVENRMEMLELELQLAIDASTVDLQRNARLPLVTLDYTYNINGLGSSFSDAFDQLNDRSFEDWSFGVSAEIPIGNQRAKARVHRAVLQRVQRLSTKQQRELAIRQEVYDAIDQLDQNWQRILAARQEVILAGRTYDAERRQFDVGIRTSTDVLNAATDLADAQSREIRALTDYQISKIDLAFATGTLLGHDRVRWEPIDASDD